MDRLIIQQTDFDVQQEYQDLLRRDCGGGAVVTFTGLVRDFNQGDKVKAIELEHYPEMVDLALHNIAQGAHARWPINALTIIHRVGVLGAREQIVFVGVSSMHRKAAFNAAEFVMDILKNRLPVWKKEQTPKGGRWVNFNQADKEAAQSWYN